MLVGVFSIHFSGYARRLGCGGSFVHTYIIRIICMRRSDIGRLKIKWGGSCMMNTATQRLRPPQLSVDTRTASNVEDRVTGSKYLYTKTHYRMQSES